MTETEFEELRRYVRLTPDDVELVRAFAVRAAPEFPRIAREFYTRAMEHEGTRALVADDDQVGRLQCQLVLWMTRVCSGCYDEAYCEEGVHIGRTHVRIGLPQGYLVAAMSLIRSSFMRIVDIVPESASATRDALNRVLDLELGLVLESYQEATRGYGRLADRFEMAQLGRTLARVEHRYVNAVEHVPALIVGLGMDGKIQLFNREAERVTGLSREEVFGESFAILVTGDRRARVASLVNQLIAGETPSYMCEAPLAFVSKGGRALEISWKFSHVPTTDDSVVLFAMGVDVTGVRALEERTRLAENAATLGTLAGALAHELRNPLNGASLHVSFLERAIKKGRGDGEMLDATQVVAGEIRKLADLVSEFMEFVRPKPLAIHSVQLIHVCERALDAVRPAATKANLQLVRDLPLTDISFDADPEKVEQVLSNLLSNAVEGYHGSKGGMVTLRAVRAARQIVFEVEDDQPALEVREGPLFATVHSTQQRSIGLGLAIVHRIVADHGGSIDVLGGPTRTMVRVALPLTQSGERKS